MKTWRFIKHITPQLFNEIVSSIVNPTVTVKIILLDLTHGDI